MNLQALAEQAFIYGYPLVDLYTILYDYAEDKSSPDYRAPLNQLYNNRKLMTPQDTSVVAPNSDTPYSMAWLDLRTEPIVVTIPEFEAGRYVALQIVDLYTYIVGYVSPRTNGHDGGDFLIAGPSWKGQQPDAIMQVFRVPTDLAFCLFRTQLFGPEDLKNVWAIQDGYCVQPLSRFLGKAAPPPPAPPIEWIEPLRVRKEPQSLRFFAVLNWMLQYAPVLPEERELREQLAAMGIQPGMSFAPPAPGDVAAIQAGMAAGLQQMIAHLQTVKSSGELFGSREFLGTNYLSRAVGAFAGILGNAQEEYLGIGYQGDDGGQPLDGVHRYHIRFAPGQLPPVKAFWSITCYNEHRLLYANEIDRYLINSPMLDRLVKDADGGFTIYVQHESPGPGKEPNWLPCPAGPFSLTFRCYQPERAIIDGTYTAPPVVKVA